MAIVEAADVQARLSSQAYTRLFARNGGATVDTTFRDNCIADAVGLVEAWTSQQFPDGLEAGGAVSRAVTLFAVKVVLYLAASNHTSASTELTTAYRPGYKDAEDFFKRLNRDQDARTTGSGRPATRASIDNLTDSGSVETNPYTRAADRADSTGF